MTLKKSVSEQVLKDDQNSKGNLDKLCICRMFTQHVSRTVVFFNVLRLHVICFPTFAFVECLKVLEFARLARMCTSHLSSSFSVDPIIGRVLPTY